MQGNGSGATLVKRANEMDAFDALPKTVRQALANSVGNYSAFTLKEVAARFGLLPGEVVEMIHVQDARLVGDSGVKAKVQ